MSARGVAWPAGAPAGGGGAGDDVPRSRGRCPYDPHTSRDLRRKLHPRQRDRLDELHRELLRRARRLAAIAARHGELI